jgi:iron complex transport system ATP-binding protein
MEAFLEARALYYAIRQIPIVDDATISLMPGRLVIVVGPNGAGKSTLLKLLSGELRPTSGEIICGGESLRRTPAWRLARRRAVMAQATQLAFPFAVDEVVRIGLDALGADAAGKEPDAIVACALRRADIVHLSHRIRYVIGRRAAADTFRPRALSACRRPTQRKPSGALSRVSICGIN